MITLDVPTVLGFIVREGTTVRHRLVIIPPLDVVREGTRAEAILEIT